MSRDYDLIVVGGGSGGLASAKRAASYGAKVAIVEGSRVGGTCVIRGCIPKKLMVYASHLGALSHIAEDYGWSHDGLELDWTKLAAIRNGIVDRLETMHEGNLDKANVTLIRGWARFVDTHAIEVDGKTLSANRFLIATGSAPVMPEFEGSDHAVTSEGLFELDHRPKSALVIGGGYIAVEYAGILQGLGCETHLVVRSKLLRGFDDDLGNALAEDLVKEGVQVHMPSTVKHVNFNDNGHDIILETDGREEKINVETCVITAIGRRPNTAGLSLDIPGVKTGNHGVIVVDEQHQSSAEHIHAIGDVIDRANLTPVAIRAGRLYADNVFGKKDLPPMSYDNIPSAVFSQPPVATVGLTEAQAKEKFGDDVTVFRSSFSPLLYAATPPERKVRSLMKMVVQTSTDRVLGCHMVGDDAPEIIQGFAVPVNMGATKADFDRTVAIHPSQAEEFVLMR